MTSQNKKGVKTLSEIEKAIEILRRDILHHDGIIARNEEFADFCRGEMQCVDSLRSGIAALRKAQEQEGKDNAK